jgi:DNA polymerase-1
MKRLVLIDGSSYLYRAFHGLPALSNAQGEPTGALFGVYNMLRASLKERPDSAAFVMDASGPTFRDELFPAYKAHRPPMPDDLRAQVEPMLAMVQALGLPILRVPGVEADDVIGTLALQGARAGMAVTISTGDKDFAQLVRPAGRGEGSIALINTMSNSRLDSDAGVMEKFGVRAEQIVDYLALMGDSVDNIPGVDKCGPKTAAKWLADYGSLDGVIANADRIGGKIGENLRAAVPRLPLNRTLTTIKTDVPLGESCETLVPRERDVEALRAFYTRYGFTQALRELEAGSLGAQHSEVPTATGASHAEPGKSRSGGYARAAEAEAVALDPALAVKGDYETLLTRDRLDAWIARLASAELIAFDTETDALDPMRANLVGLSFAVECRTGGLPAAGTRLSRRAAAAAARGNPRRAQARCSKTQPGPSSASTASTTCMCCAAMASSFAATPRTRCCRVSC